MNARAILVTALLVTGACAYTATSRAPRIEARVATPASPWTGLEPLEEPDDFRFVVVTDRTGEHREGVFEGAMPKVNLLQPAFVMSVGDLIEGYTEDPAELDQQWDEFESFVARLQMPFFYVPGNHDMSNEAMANEWRERFGPTFYHFRYKNVLFVALNSELFGMVHDPRRSLPGPETQAQQMAWLERVLDENRDARWTLVFLHQPLWDKKEVPADWLRVEELLGDRHYTVFAGHYHRYTSHVRNDRHYVTLATTGGGSELRGLVFGEFDHVALVTMKREGPVIANLLLDGIHDRDVRTAAVRGVVQGLEKAIEVEPIEASSDPFRSGRARFEVANRLERPLEVEAVVDGGSHLRTVFDRVQRSVAPGATESVELAVSAAEYVPLAELEPGRVHWTLRSRTPDGTPVEIQTNSLILPERRFPIPRLRRKVKLDGAIDEWGELPLAVANPVEIEAPELHAGPDDASFRFAVAWDDEWLYIAADVVDDALVLSADRTWREQDHLSFSIDARPDPERSANESINTSLSNGALRKLIQPNAAPVEAKADRVTSLFAGGLPEGTKVASQLGRGGYTVELAIPSAALDRLAGSRWRELRINVSQHDFDPGSPGHSTLWFRPDRFGRLAIPGSGTFERK
jgi:hypothetical protein